MYVYLYSYFCLFFSITAGAPIYFSSPHFLYGENLLEFVEGLEPIEEEHRVYFALEMVN